MKIAIIITDITGDGGTERTSVLLANTLQCKGHHVTIISLFKKGKAVIYDLASGINIVYLVNNGYSIKTSKINRFKKLLRARENLKRELSLSKFDEIISQAFLPTFILYTLDLSS